MRVQVQLRESRQFHGILWAGTQEVPHSDMDKVIIFRSTLIELAALILTSAPGIDGAVARKARMKRDASQWMISILTYSSILYDTGSVCVLRFPSTYTKSHTIFEDFVSVLHGMPFQGPQAVFSRQVR